MTLKYYCKKCNRFHINTSKIGINHDKYKNCEFIINLTPHTITVGNKKYPVSGTVARVSTTAKYVGVIDGSDLVKSYYHKVVKLPKRTPGKFYIVSRMVKDYAPNRDDCIVPDIMIRDKTGKIVRAKRWSL